MPTCLDVCSRRSNNLVNDVHEIALKLIYDDQYSSFTQRLRIKDYSSTEHSKRSTKEAHKFINNLPLPIVSNSFQICEKVHNLRNFQQLANPKSSTVKQALERNSYRGWQLWNLVPSEIRNSLTFQYLEKI